jgi:hypothetical protein
MELVASSTPGRRERWIAHLTLPRLLILHVLLVVLAHLPIPVLYMEADDYLLESRLTAQDPVPGTPTLEGSPLSRITDTFRFFSPRDGSLQAYRDYGNLPWWSTEEGHMAPLRPLAAMLHWFDYSAFDNDPLLSGSLSLLVLLFQGAAALLLGRQLGGGMGRSLLFAALLTWDLSMLYNFKWLAARNAYLATAFGMLSLAAFLQWRQTGSTKAMIASIIALLAALLSAEAAIAICGYFFAYAVTADRRGPLRALFALAPFAILVVAWRVAYNLAGHGSTNIGLYVDPGHEPLRFLEQLVQVLPCIIASVIIGIDNLPSSVGPTDTPWVVAVAWTIIALALIGARRLLRDDPVARFMALGAALAAIPHSALLSAGSRSGTFVAIGLFYVLCRWIESTWQRRHERRRHAFTSGLAITWHCVLPGLVALAVSLRLVTPAPYQNPLDTLTAPALHEGQRSLVVVNPPAPTQLFYLPFEWQHQGRPLPPAIHSLAPGMTSLRLERTGERSFLLRSTQPMAVNHQVDISLGGQYRGQHPAFINQMLHGLVTSPLRRFTETGDIRAAGMTITPVEVDAGLPVAVRIRFDGDINPDDLVWTFYDWKKARYELMAAPKRGEVLHFSGPLPFQG